MRVGLLTTAIFGDLSGYFFVYFRDKANNIKTYMTICYPLLACDWLQNERPVMYMSKSVFGQHFLTQSVWLWKIIAWKVTNRSMIPAAET